jgi:hypothetical protein
MELQREVLFRDSLECILEGRSFFLPADEVARVIELEVASLPLARAPISSAGVHEGVLVFTLRPLDAAPSQSRRAVTAVLLRRSRSDCRYAIEVDRVGSIVRAQRWLPVDQLLKELGVDAQP